MKRFLGSVVSAFILTSAFLLCSSANAATIGVPAGGTGTTSFKMGEVLVGNDRGYINTTSSPTFSIINLTSSTDTSTFEGNVDVKGNLKVGGVLFAPVVLTAQGNLYVTGNLGIGTSTPLARLDVWGNLNVATGTNPALFVNTALGQVGINTSTPPSNFTVVSNNAVSNILGVYTSTTNPALIVNNAGKVGIGTVTPSSPLHIYGATSGYTPALRVSDQNSSLGAALYFEWRGGAVNNKIRNIAIDSNGLGFYRMTDAGNAYLNVIPDLVLSPSGYVGIGTTAVPAILSLATSTVAAGGINSGGDTDLYRSAADTLKTDDRFSMATTLSASGDVGANVQITGGGSGVISAAKISLLAGYTGGLSNFGVYAQNQTPGTATDEFANVQAANYGEYIATTAGTVVGQAGYASGGDKSYGGFFRAIVAKSYAANIGVGGFGSNSGTNAVQVGGYFGLMSTAPAYNLSAALIADNGAQTAPIFVARDNGTEVMRIADGGYVGIGTTTPLNDFHVVGLSVASTSTIAVGQAGVKAGCMKFQDQDLAGWTYCSYLNGTQTCNSDNTVVGCSP